MTERLFAFEPESASSTAGLGYYGVPMIHEPHWKWLIIAYFFLGGISGTTSALGGLARLSSTRESLAIGRLGSYVAFFTLLPCPILLILDLGRPRRFLNMLRAFRPSSPMSMGTWGLAGFGALTMSAAAVQLRDDLRASPGAERLGMSAWPRRVLATANVISGLFVAGYTGVLLSATAVPLWSKRPALLGPLFLSSAMASGAASIELVWSVASPSPHPPESLSMLKSLSSLAEGALLLGWIVALGSTAGPSQIGWPGVVMRHVVVGTGIAAPALLHALTRHLRGDTRRASSLLASSLTLAGGFALRYVVIEGGRASARDPRATIEMTR